MELRADAHWMDRRLRGTVLQGTESSDDGTTGGLSAMGAGLGGEGTTATLVIVRRHDISPLSADRK
jgi:hypothetical protein